ncbi:MAG: DUF4321 domain-containing protein [Paenibacillaceae bacterium]|uniref:DUF4321 domain-containing protein n=1 Tax=Paenibacillus cymbidii TaxID=1639034 RepID=UPI0010822C0D|nr:DUF4321 domain-containing protein [Paenibacillus cymbidii]MBO9604392.1 DUF4321 domain-containing protein [Paenibacillaceae bacterium]
MKKNNWVLLICLILGLVAGMIVSELLAPVSGLSVLTKSVSLTWQPKADLSVIKYDLDLQIKLNLLCIIGVAAAFWIYRKL